MTTKNTIPLIVDSVKKRSGFEMTRMIYFSIGAVEYLSELNIDYERFRYPVAVLDLHGIIINPPGKDEFGNAGEIDELFDNIESNEELFVDTNDLWIPNLLLKDQTKRGDLFRVSFELFRLSLSYRNDKLPYDDFLSQAGELSSEIFHAPKEEKVFRDWSGSQIDFAREAYYSRDPEKNLKYQ